jgi:hypothetical protein
MKLTQGRLKEVMSYEPNTGVFLWLIDRTNGVKAGDIVGCIESKGYKVTSIDGEAHKLHRLAFFYMTGEMPFLDVDHINGITSDNRWGNLRLVSVSENGKNRRLDKRSTSGISGVYHHRSGWVARINSNGVRHRIGVYRDFFEACCARKSAELKLSYHPNHGRRAV